MVHLWTTQYYILAFQYVSRLLVTNTVQQSYLKNLCCGHEIPIRYSRPVSKVVSFSGVIFSTLHSCFNNTDEWFGFQSERRINGCERWPDEWLTLKSELFFFLKWTLRSELLLLLVCSMKCGNVAYAEMKVYIYLFLNFWYLTFTFKKLYRSLLMLLFSQFWHPGRQNIYHILVHSRS
jgi:hypothetical protein